MIFDEAPWLYDRYRPGYPDAAVEALVGLAELRPGSTVLEVGAGTGQLTPEAFASTFTVALIRPRTR